MYRVYYGFQKFPSKVKCSKVAPKNYHICTLRSICKCWIIMPSSHAIMKMPFTAGFTVLTPCEYWWVHITVVDAFPTTLPLNLVALKLHAYFTFCCANWNSCNRFDLEAFQGFHKVWDVRYNCHLPERILQLVNPKTPLWTFQIQFRAIYSGVELKLESNGSQLAKLGIELELLFAIIANNYLWHMIIKVFKYGPGSGLWQYLYGSRNYSQINC